jgi:hypothetical protein
MCYIYFDVHWTDLCNAIHYICMLYILHHFECTYDRICDVYYTRSMYFIFYISLYLLMTSYVMYYTLSMGFIFYISSSVLMRLNIFFP